MRKNKTNLPVLLVLIVLSVGGLAPASAQSTGADQRAPNHVNTTTRILYHGGHLMAGAQDVYLIWYGCWDDNCGLAGDTASQFILTHFMSSLGGSLYFQINATYPNSFGQTPTGALFYAGSVFDRYSHGLELTAADIQEIVADKIETNELPQDPVGIYLVIGSADVSSEATGFCIPNAQPHHGRGTGPFGVYFNYAFVGNPVRCPTLGAAQFIAADGSRLPTPNGHFGADAMASTMAHLLDAIVTNPWGDGWFDRYGLENADKCAGTFGQTYTTPNGARANVKLGGRDYLIQQNWVNDRKGRCAMLSGGQ
jgi:hypothetical protein